VEYPYDSKQEDPLIPLALGVEEKLIPKEAKPVEEV